MCVASGISSQSTGTVCVTTNSINSDRPDGRSLLICRHCHGISRHPSRAPILLLYCYYHPITSHARPERYATHTLTRADYTAQYGMPCTCVTFSCSLASGRRDRGRPHTRPRGNQPTNPPQLSPGASSGGGAALTLRARPARRGWRADLSFSERENRQRFLALDRRRLPGRPAKCDRPIERDQWPADIYRRSRPRAKPPSIYQRRRHFCIGNCVSRASR